MGQARIDSFMEAVTNTAIGFTVSMGVQLVVAHVYQYHVSMLDNMVIVGIFTAVSVARQYILRRLFDGKTVWQYIKLKISGATS